MFLSGGTCSFLRRSRAWWGCEKQIKAQHCLQKTCCTLKRFTAYIILLLLGSVSFRWTIFICMVFWIVCRFVYIIWQSFYPRRHLWNFLEAKSSLLCVRILSVFAASLSCCHKSTEKFMSKLLPVLEKCPYVTQKEVCAFESCLSNKACAGKLYEICVNFPLLLIYLLWMTPSSERNWMHLKFCSLQQNLQNWQMNISWSI